MAAVIAQSSQNFVRLSFILFPHQPHWACFSALSQIRLGTKVPIPVPGILCPLTSSLNYLGLGFYNCDVIPVRVKEFV